MSCDRENVIVLIGCSPEFTEMFKAYAETFAVSGKSPLVSDLSVKAIGDLWTRSYPNDGFIESAVAAETGLLFSLRNSTFSAADVISVVVDCALASDTVGWHLKMAFKNATFFKVRGTEIVEKRIWCSRRLQPQGNKFKQRVLLSTDNGLSNRDLELLGETYAEFLLNTAEEITNRVKNFSEENLTVLRQQLAQEGMYLRGELEIMKSLRYPTSP